MSGIVRGLLKSKGQATHGAGATTLESHRKQCCTHFANDVLACDLLTLEYHKQVFEVIITLVTSDIPCSFNGTSTLVYL